jgi:cold shock CspA family protein
MSETQVTAYTILLDGKRLTGSVKWFNNKSGFGFITVCGEGEYSGKDIFAHYSSIRKSDTPQSNTNYYRYLVQGEYVDFTLVKPDSGKHDCQAIDITGVLGGNTMCETQRINNTNVSYSGSRLPFKPRSAYGAPRVNSISEDAPAPVNVTESTATATATEGFQEVKTRKVGRPRKTT